MGHAGRIAFTTVAACFTLAFTCTAFPGEPSGSGHFTEYEYDDQGRVIGVVTVVDEAPPVISHIDPEVVRRGPAVAATIYGSGLRQAQIDTGHTGLTVSAMTSSATWVSFKLTADESVPLGEHALTLTTTLGSDTVDIEVYPRLPVLQVTPDPVAVTPGQEVSVSIGIDTADVVDHVFNLSSGNPSVAGISSAAVLIEAGELAPQESITLSGTALGTASLRIETERKVSTFFQHIGDFFYVTTAGSSTLTGVGSSSKAFSRASISLATWPSSGLIATRAGGRVTLGGPLT